MGFFSWLFGLKKKSELEHLKKQSKISSLTELARLGKIIVQCENCAKNYYVLYPSNIAKCPYCGLERIFSINIIAGKISFTNCEIVENQNRFNSNFKNKSQIGFVLGEPDTRTSEEIDNLKNTFLHTEAQKFSDGICSIGQADNEKLIARTENLVKKVTYIATLDNACCPLCWPLDGVDFDVDITKRPPVPRHKNCRCLYLPKAKIFQDFGIAVAPLPPVERPWVLADYQYTYKRNPQMKLKKARRIIRNHGKFKGNAETWIKSLPIHEQRQFFPSDISYNLWRTGKIKAIDMLNPKTWQLRSDEELKRLFS